MAHYVPWEIPREVIKELGVAALIASILAATVDQALKTDLAKDAFYAAFSYVLPEELKDEVTRIINYKFLCIEHYMLVEITEINDELVRVHMSTERTIRNVSRYAEPMQGRYAIDEWGFPGHPSRIDRCTLELGGETLSGDDNPEYNKGDALGKITAERKIKPEETAKLVSVGSEVHRNNGELLMGFRAPTIQPIVDIRVPPGFKHSCSFGVPDEKVASSDIVQRYRLNGTQFPGQNTRVRWWRDPTLFSQISPLSKEQPS